MNLKFFKNYQINTFLFAQSSKDPLFSQKSNALPKNLKKTPLNLARVARQALLERLARVCSARRWANFT